MEKVVGEREIKTEQVRKKGVGEKRRQDQKRKRRENG